MEYGATSPSDQAAPRAADEPHGGSPRRRRVAVAAAAAVMAGSAVLLSTSRTGPPSLVGRMDDWTPVRCVSSKDGTWHPATDMLQGTESYGTRLPVTADATWSMTWDWDDCDELMLALNDFSYWLVVDKSQLQNYGAPVSTRIEMSSYSDTPYNAEWYLRGPTECAADLAAGKNTECGASGALEDPWATVFDHETEEAGYVYGENSATGHREHLASTGACVYVRKRTVETAAVLTGMVPGPYSQ